MMLSGVSPNGNEAEPPAETAADESASIFDLMLGKAPGDLDHIAEPSAAELAAIDELENLDDIVDLDAPPLADPLPRPALNPALSLLAEIEEPELVSLESLDELEQEFGQDLDDVEELLDDAGGPFEDYIELDLEDDELEDEGYDLDDEDDGSYHDLYGEDDAIIPSFREGEFAEEDDGDTAYYDDLR